MPDPKIDPRWVALAARARTMRQELDRLDNLADQLEPAERTELLCRLVAIREELDQFDAELEARAAGL
jgi:hypothetical protein